jgi:hypothetical protein
MTMEAPDFRYVWRLQQLTGACMFIQLDVHSDGLLFLMLPSFGRRRRKRKSPEREPPLPSRTDSTESLPDVLAAFKGNKLPSQNQLDSFLQSVLHSDDLDVNGDGVTGYGPIQGR